MTTNEALLQIVHNEPSFCFGTKSTRLALTRQAGMMGPVRFFADGAQPIQPYYIAPWWAEGCSSQTPPLHSILRGDFFCAPFGGNEEPFNGRTHPPHGQAANGAWEIEGLETTGRGTALSMSQRQTLQEGTIRKWLAVLEGQSVVYSRHELAGMEGPMCLGHHPNLFVPEGAGQGTLSFAPHRYAHTYVNPTEMPEKKGYSLLKPDSPIEDLKCCPTISGARTDLTRYPARRGWEDIVILCAAENLELGWSAFSLPSLGYVWFSLKDPRALVSTILWMSNGGRHYPPWNGRNVNCLGVEEITGFFHEGIASSAKKNFLNAMGVPTSVMLEPTRPLRVNFIQGVARISPDFTGVRAIEPTGESTIRITSESGARVDVSVEWSFLEQGKLKDFSK